MESCEKKLRNNFYACELSFLPTRSRFCGKKHIGKSTIKTAKKTNNPKESVLHFQLVIAKTFRWLERSGLSWRIPPQCQQYLGNCWSWTSHSLSFALATKIPKDINMEKNDRWNKNTEAVINNEVVLSNLVDHPETVETNRYADPNHPCMVCLPYMNGWFLWISCR